jgi:hypothetical protein
METQPVGGVMEAVKATVTPEFGFDRLSRFLFLHEVSANDVTVIRTKNANLITLRRTIFICPEKITVVILFRF